MFPIILNFFVWSENASAENGVTKMDDRHGRTGKKWSGHDVARNGLRGAIASGLFLSAALALSTGCAVTTKGQYQQGYRNPNMPSPYQAAQTRLLEQRAAQAQQAAAAAPLAQTEITQLKGKFLQLKVTNRTVRSLEGIDLLVRGESCAGTPPERVWLHSSRSTLARGYERVITFELPVYCRDVSVVAVGY